MNYLCRFQNNKIFPIEEKYSLTDQIRRSSRSVSANLAEASRKIKYEKNLCFKTHRL
ncbi:four helix bundle protein [Flavobacterium daejeonense]|uniref:four helix bundle protein n=1 Tax=Flavobacterium daejeonense TaxID=350893 RepID=UPI002934FD73|nr:four helix bundle protein [Flavobacterium daejeonense]